MIFTSASGRTVVTVDLDSKTGKGAITVTQDDRRVHTIDIGAEKSLADGNLGGAPDSSPTMLRNYSR